ncbi:MAG: hypothetical protein H7A33_03950 [Deltaproteobacteria bacterium]|nr:hypothetical protein [Deltaproteobacteria bacterium]
MIFSPRFHNPFPIFPAIDPIVIPEQPSPFLDAVTQHHFVVNHFIDAFIVETPLGGVVKRPLEVQIFEKPISLSCGNIYSDPDQVYEFHRVSPSYLEQIDSQTAQMIVSGIYLLFGASAELFDALQGNDDEADLGIDLCESSLQVMWKPEALSLFHDLDDVQGVKIAKRIFADILAPLFGIYSDQDAPDPVHQIDYDYFSDFLDRLLSELSHDQKNEVIRFWLNHLFEIESSETYLIAEDADDFFFIYFLKMIDDFDVKTLQAFYSWINVVDENSLYKRFNTNVFVGYFLSEDDGDFIGEKLSKICKRSLCLSEDERNQFCVRSLAMVLFAFGTGEAFIPFVGQLLREFEQIGFDLNQKTNAVKEAIAEMQSSLGEILRIDALQTPMGMSLFNTYPQLRAVLI